MSTGNSKKAEKKYGDTIRIPRDSKETLEWLTKHYHLDQKIVLTTLIDMAKENDLLNPGWVKRFNAMLRQAEKALQLEMAAKDSERCDSQRYAEGTWKCIFGRKSKTPMIRNLAKEYDETIELCLGCKISLIKDDRIDELEYNLHHARAEVLEYKESMKMKVPVCNRGSILTNEGKEFRGCPKGQANKPVSIEKWCKVYSNGLPCQLYAEITVGLQEKIK